MTTRKTLAGLALVMSGFGSGAMAADGTIKFEGDIVDTPCVVSSESSDQTVSMGKVKSSIFTKAKDVAPEQGFNIKLDECSTSVKKNANVTFIGTQDTADNTLLAINNASGAAKGVGIEILNNSGTAIAMGSASADTALKDGQDTLLFKARYKSTAATVTPGSANAQTDFEVNYK
ncbi:fimbrial protein [Enterobacter bugandensis]